MEQKKTKIKTNIEGKIPKNSGLNRTKIKEIVDNALSNFELSSQKIEVEIIFVEDKKIKELNNLYRNIDKPTDVLSFPQTQLANSKINILGSIIICAKMVEEKQELLTDVIKHGLLHLLGFDHETDKDEKKWIEQAKIINCNL